VRSTITCLLDHHAARGPGSAPAGARESTAYQGVLEQALRDVSAQHTVHPSRLLMTLVLRGVRRYSSVTTLRSVAICSEARKKGALEVVYVCGPLLATLSRLLRQRGHIPRERRPALFNTQGTMRNAQDVRFARLGIGP
jgi:hypothetical protein